MFGRPDELPAIVVSEQSFRLVESVAVSGHIYVRRGLFIVIFIFVYM